MSEDQDFNSSPLGFIAKIRDRLGEKSSNYKEFCDVLTSYGGSADLAKAASQSLVRRVEKILEHEPDLFQAFAEFVPSLTQTEVDLSDDSVAQQQGEVIDKLMAILKAEYGGDSREVQEAQLLFSNWCKQKHNPAQKLSLAQKLPFLWSNRPELQSKLLPLIRKLSALGEEKSPEPLSPVVPKPACKKSRKRKIEFKDMGQNKRLKQMNSERVNQITEYLALTRYQPSDASIFRRFQRLYPPKTPSYLHDSLSLHNPPTNTPPVWKNLLARMKRTMEPKKYYQVLRAMDLFSRDGIEVNELIDTLQPLLRGKEFFYHELCVMLGATAPTRASNADHKYRLSFYEYVANVNLEECTKIGSSYRELPDDVVRPAVSHRNYIAKENLNDEYVCLCRGGENTSGKPPTEQKNATNIYIDNINEAQQRTFLCNIWIHRLERSLMRLETLQRTLEGERDMLSDHVKSFLDDTDLRMVTTLYADHAGDKMLEFLESHPVTTLKVLIPRYKLKLKEWREVYADVKTELKVVMDKNHLPSFDLMGKMFKSSDKKRLTNTDLIWIELLELSNPSLGQPTLNGGQHKKLPLSRCSFTLGNEKSPCIRLDFPDVTVHEHCFNVIRHSCAQCGRSRKWLVVWRKLFHKFFDFQLGTESWIRALQEDNQSSDSDREASDDESDMEDTELSLHWNFKAEETPAGLLTDSNILILNKPFYVFLRLYSQVYNRLLRAQELCGRDRGLHATDLVNNPNATYIPCSKQKQNDHKAFYEYLYGLINGELQEEDFEKQLHRLLGPQCYQLVTMKHLLKAVERQLAGLNSGDVKYETRKILRLYQEHSAQKQSLESAGTWNPADFARVYLENFTQNCTEEGALLQYFSEDKSVTGVAVQLDE